jgi:hypothetical protein
MIFPQLRLSVEVRGYAPLTRNYCLSGDRIGQFSTEEDR